jgi:hypothetical protein
MSETRKYEMELILGQSMRSRTETPKDLTHIQPQGDHVDNDPAVRPVSDRSMPSERSQQTCETFTQLSLNCSNSARDVLAALDRRNRRREVRLGTVLRFEFPPQSHLADPYGEGHAQGNSKKPILTLNALYSLAMASISLRSDSGTFT